MNNGVVHKKKRSKDKHWIVSGNEKKVLNYTNDLIKIAILLKASNSLLNERFYWTIVQWEKEPKRLNMSENFKNERNHF